MYLIQGNLSTLSDYYLIFQRFSLKWNELLKLRSYKSLFQLLNRKYMPTAIVSIQLIILTLFHIGQNKYWHCFFKGKHKYLLLLLYSVYYRLSACLSDRQCWQCFCTENTNIFFCSCIHSTTGCVFVCSADNIVNVLGAVHKWNQVIKG